MHRDCIVKRAKRNHIKDRCERFALHDGHVVACANDSGFDEMTFTVNDFTAAQKNAALCLRGFDRSSIVTDGDCIDQRSHEYICFEWITNLYLAVSADEPPLEFLLSRFVNENTSSA